MPQETQRPRETQEAGAKVLEFCEHPALWGKTTTPATNLDVLVHCGEEGQSPPGLLCPLNWLLVFLCPSVCWQPSEVGTFVRLEFTLQQTGCWKKDWKKAECKVKPSGVSGHRHTRV